jgi:hypothetical protein
MRVCIVGCERSGTSAVSTLLSIGSGWSFLDDPQESWYIYPQIYQGKSGLPWPLWWKLRRHKIVKVPGFATVLPYLQKSHVGDFVACYCIRDPRDTVAALLERLQHGESRLLTDVSWLDIRVSDHVEALAWRWRKYLECAENYRVRGGRIHFIKYEEFFSDREANLMKLARNIPMPFDCSKTRPVLQRQFRKSWSSEMLGPRRWIRDLQRSAVDKIENICGDLMGEWGYDG